MSRPIPSDSGLAMRSSPNFSITVWACLALFNLTGCPVEGDVDSECSDGLDNDGNGLFDCNDPGCFDADDCEEFVETDWDALEGVGIAGLINYTYLNPENLVGVPDDEVWAIGRFFEAQELDPGLDVLSGRTIPAAGECVLIEDDQYETSWVGIGLDAGAPVTLDGPTTIEMNRHEDIPSSENYHYYKKDLSPDAYDAGEYSLIIPGGNFPAQTITTAIVTPPQFTFEPHPYDHPLTMNDYSNGFSFTLSEPCDNIDLFMGFYGGADGYQLALLQCHYDSAENLVVSGDLTSPYGGGCTDAGTLCGVGVRIDCNQNSYSLTQDGYKFVGAGHSLVWGGYLFD